MAKNTKFSPASIISNMILRACDDLRTFSNYACWTTFFGKRKIESQKSRFIHVDQRECDLTIQVSEKKKLEVQDFSHFISGKKLMIKQAYIIKYCKTKETLKKNLKMMSDVNDHVKCR